MRRHATGQEPWKLGNSDDEFPSEFPCATRTAAGRILRSNGDLVFGPSDGEGEGQACIGAHNSLQSLYHPRSSDAARATGWAQANETVVSGIYHWERQETL